MKTLCYIMQTVQLPNPNLIEGEFGRAHLPAWTSSPPQLHRGKQSQTADCPYQRKQCRLGILNKAHHLSPHTVLTKGKRRVRNQPRNGTYFRLLLAVILQYLGNIYFFGKSTLKVAPENWPMVRPHEDLLFQE